MIIKKRVKNNYLSKLEVLNRRGSLSPVQENTMKQLAQNNEMEMIFESYTNDLDVEKFDLIWQFNYSDYHQDSLIHLVAISNHAIYLFKLNDYSGLHYINHEGMLADYFSDDIKLDLVQLNCVKYSIRHILDPKYKHLPIIVKSVCLNDSFELDVHSDNNHFLLRKDISNYFSKMNKTCKKKLHLVETD